MKAHEVNVGGLYAAKVSGQVATLRIERADDRGGYHAVNLASRRAIRLKSARRLIQPVRDCTAPASEPPPASVPLAVPTELEPPCRLEDCTDAYAVLRWSFKRMGVAETLRGLCVAFAIALDQGEVRPEEALAREAWRRIAELVA